MSATSDILIPLPTIFTPPPDCQTTSNGIYPLNWGHGCTLVTIQSPGIEITTAVKTHIASCFPPSYVSIITSRPSIVPIYSPALGCPVGWTPNFEVTKTGDFVGIVQSGIWDPLTTGEVATACCRSEFDLNPTDNYCVSMITNTNLPSITFDNSCHTTTTSVDLSLGQQSIDYPIWVVEAPITSTAPPPSGTTPASPQSANSQPQNTGTQLHESGAASPTGPSMPKENSSGLSTGTKIAIGVVVPVVVIIIAIIVVLVCWRRRKKRAAKQYNSAPGHASNFSTASKAELEGSAPNNFGGYGRHTGGEKVELDATHEARQYYGARGIYELPGGNEGYKHQNANSPVASDPVIPTASLQQDYRSEPWSIQHPDYQVQSNQESAILPSNPPRSTLPTTPPLEDAPSTNRDVAQDGVSSTSRPQAEIDFQEREAQLNAEIERLRQLDNLHRERELIRSQMMPRDSTRPP